MSIVFNFSGNVTIHVSGAGNVALTADAPAPAFVAGIEAPAAVEAPAASPAIDGDARLAKLRELLNDQRFKFRKLETLANAIGEDDDTTVELLESIDARQEKNNEELWGLTSRVGEARSTGYGF